MNKIRLITSVLRANDFWWAVLFLMERVLKSKGFQKRRLQYERDRQLPGLNTIQYNQKEWSNYQWSRGGEEWTDSPEWKKSLLEVMSAYLKPGSIVLEIGPGGGRWSVELVKIANKLILVDLTSEAIHATRQRLSNYQYCEFYQNDGKSLSMIGDNSIDHIWSFDVFVHIAPTDTVSYIYEIRRVLKSGGTAVIHHPYNGGLSGGFRSGVTNEKFLDYLKAAQLELITQISSFGIDTKYNFLEQGDIISVFRKTSC